MACAALVTQPGEVLNILEGSSVTTHLAARGWAAARAALASEAFHRDGSIGFY